MLRFLLYGQKGWDTKQVLFIVSPLPYVVIKNAILYKKEKITYCGEKLSLAVLLICVLKGQWGRWEGASIAEV